MEAAPVTHQKYIIEHQLDIAKFKFYSNIAIGEFGEGVHVTRDNAQTAIQLVQQQYGGTRPFVYISHRCNSYSMDTMGYKEVLKLFPNFLGVAVVSQNKYRRMLVALERLFINKPVAVFHDMDSAFEWAEELLGTTA